MNRLVHADFNSVISDYMEQGFPALTPNTRRRKWEANPPITLNSLNTRNTEIESPVLQIACFVKTPRLCFNDVKVGEKRVLSLRIYNPSSEAEVLVLDKFPAEETGFSLEGKALGVGSIISFEPQEEKSLFISWTPLCGGNCRHLMMFKWEGGQKLQIVLLGSAVDSKTTKMRGYSYSRLKTTKKSGRKPLQQTTKPNRPMPSFIPDKVEFNVEPLGLKIISPKTLGNTGEKVFVEIQPDTPSRRSTFSVTTPKAGEETGIVSENKENVDLADTNTFHESEIRMSSSPVSCITSPKQVKNEAWQDSINCLDVGEVILNGVKRQVIPFPSLTTIASEDLLEDDSTDNCQTVVNNEEKITQEHLSAEHTTDTTLKMTTSHRNFEDSSKASMTDTKENTKMKKNINCKIKASSKVSSNLTTRKRVKGTRGSQEQGTSRDSHIQCSKHLNQKPVPGKSNKNTKSHTEKLIQRTLGNKTVEEKPVEKLKKQQPIKNKPPNQVIGGKVTDAKFKTYEPISLKRKQTASEGTSTIAAKPGVAIKKLRLIKPKKTSIPRHPMPYAAKNMFYDERWIDKQERGFTNWLNFLLTPSDDIFYSEEAKEGKTALILLLWSLYPFRSHNFAWSRVYDGKRDWYSTRAKQLLHFDEETRAAFGEFLNSLLTMDPHRKQPVAPSREALSFRAYSARRQMARLRRSACLLYQSEPLAHIICKLEREIEKGHLAIRLEKHIEADLGIKKNICDMLLSFNPLWLRIGLEVVYGEIIPMQSNTDTQSLSRFIYRRLLGNPDIAATFAHSTVPGLYKPGYEEALAKFILKKFLMLVLFLDRAKLTRLLEHDPCLFRKDSEFKSNRDLLLTFSRDYLKGEGDLTKHLSYLGFSVSHSQTAIDEYDFGVKNIAVDLRDGIRLVRVVELLTQCWKLSKVVRVPAVSRLQKIHNVEVAFDGLIDHGLDVLSNHGLDPRQVVDGHREKTLLLLWQIIFHFQVGILLDEKKLEDEIKHLKSSLKLKSQLAMLYDNPGSCVDGNKRESLDGVYFKSKKLDLLLKWTKFVCAFHGIKVENFTVSFSDGRALCYLIHHYHPCVLTRDMIEQETTVTCGKDKDDDDIDDDLIYENWTNCFSPSTGVNKRLERLLANEKKNFKLLNEKITELGGVPTMMNVSDMSNTIPDEKVVILYVSFLCARLLDIREEIRAARCIQMVWRQYRLHKERGKLKVLSAAATKIQARIRAFLEQRRSIRKKKAAILIQSHVRGLLVRRQLQYEDDAAGYIQEVYRAWKHGKDVRTSFLKKKQAAVTIQSAFRAFLRKRADKEMKAAITIQAAWLQYHCRKTYSKTMKSLIRLQACIRRFLACRLARKRREAALIIQTRVKAWIQGEKERKCYLALKNAAISIQTIYRACRERKRLRRVKAAVSIQSCIRMKLQRNTFLSLRKATIVIQSAYRRSKQRKKFLKMKHAVTTLQERYRAAQQGRRIREKYERKRIACVRIQAWIRGRKQRHLYVELRRAVTICQSYVRRNITKNNYVSCVKAAVVLQRRFRALKQGQAVRLKCEHMRFSCVKVQSWYRARIVNRQYRKLKEATITCQALVRRNIAGMKFKELRSATILLQRRYRAMIQGRETREQYALMKTACVKIQSLYRMCRQRRRFLHTKKAIIICQALARRSFARSKYEQLKRVTIHCQALVRRNLARKKLKELYFTTVLLQRHYRANRAGRDAREKYLSMKAACIKIQSWFRMSRQRHDFLRTRKAVTACQAVVRRNFAVKKFKSLVNSVITLQRSYRAMKKSHFVRLEYLQTKKSCIMIQAFWRGYKIRKEYVKLKRAAIILQSHVRRNAALKKYRSMRSAAIVIQRWFRAVRLGNEVRTEYFGKMSACVKIQSMWKCYQARKDFKRMRRAVILCQSYVRRNVALNQYKAYRSAAIVIQRRFRAVMEGKVMKLTFAEIKSACIVIQSSWKAYTARREFCKLRHSVVCCQSYVRRKMAMKKYKAIHFAAVISQRRFRASLERRRVRSGYLRTKYACVKIQSMWRCHKVQKEFNEVRTATILLQSCVRRSAAASQYRACRSAAIVIQRRLRAVLEKRAVMARFVTMKSACVLIQSSWRGYRTRRRFLLLRQSVILCQSYVRRNIAMKKYKVIRSAAIVIQRRFKAFAKGKQIRGEYMAAKSACIKIQSSWKGYKRRKEFLEFRKAAVICQACIRRNIATRKYKSVIFAVRTIQTQYRALRLSQAVQIHYHIIRGAVIMLQAASRGFLVRKDVRRKFEAAVKIQSQFKCLRSRQRYLRLKKSAIVVQRRYRATRQARMAMTEYQTKKESIIRIQAVVRGHLLRRKIHRMSDAAIKIQAFFKGYKERKQYMLLRAAAMVIQKRYRASVLTKQAVQNFQVQKRAVIKLQALVRCHLLRKRFLRTKRAVNIIKATYKAYKEATSYQRMRTAVICIQRRLKAYVSGKKQRAVYKTQRNAVVLLQATARMVAAKKKFATYRNSVVVLQRRFRATLLMRKERQNFTKLKESAVCIQSTYRMHVFRAKFVKMSIAALKIQSVVRSHLAVKRFNRIRTAVILIQSDVRARIAKQKYRNLRLVAIKLQRWYRERARLNKIRARYLQMKFACTRIQACCRGYLARKHVQRIKAAISVQSMWRKHKDMKLYASRRRACILIQSVVRRYLARQSYSLCQGAVLTIQRHYRAYLVGSLERLCYQYKRGACITIQASIRMWICRKKFIQKKQSLICIQKRWKAMLASRKQRLMYVTQRKAAIRIQSVYRGYLSRKHAKLLHTMRMVERQLEMIRQRKIEIARNNAATVIQKNWKCQRKLRLFLLMQKAAITIQMCYRGHLLMKKERSSFLTMKASAVKLQSNFRRYHSQKLLKELKDLRDRRTNAAYTIQKFYRACLLRRKAVYEYQCTIQAVIIIQRVFRGYVQRRNYQRLRTSAVLTQSCFRMRHGRNRYLQQKEAIIKVQRWYRTFSEVRKTREAFQEKRKAALVIQTHYRAFCARRETKKLKRILTIQAFVRMTQQRRRYLKMKYASIVIQRRWKATFAKITLRKKQAAVMVQSLFRGYKARQAYQKLREDRKQSVLRFTAAGFFSLSAIQIQRWYRKSQALALARSELKAVLLIQHCIRGFLIRRRYLNLVKATIRAQRLWRKQYSYRNKAARMIQSIVRSWLAKNHVKRMQTSATKIQSLWRGYKIRRNNANAKVKKARKRIQSANENVTEEMKLCNRTKSALDYLLSCRNMTTIFDALRHLDVVTNLSFKCCEQLVEDNALRVIFKIIKGSNRSLPSIELIQVAISILTNLARCSTTYQAVYDQDNSVSLLLELMTNFREKKGTIFPRTCNLLNILCHDPSICQDVLNIPRTAEKIQSMHYLTRRKHKIEAKRGITKEKLFQQSMATAAKTPFKTPRRRKRAWYKMHSNRVNTLDPLTSISDLMRTFRLEPKK